MCFSRKRDGKLRQDLIPGPLIQDAVVPHGNLNLPRREAHPDPSWVTLVSSNNAKEGILAHIAESPEEVDFRHGSIRYWS